MSAGNSLGGWIALEMGAVAPDKVKSITALCPRRVMARASDGEVPTEF